MTKLHKCAIDAAFGATWVNFIDYDPVQNLWFITKYQKFGLFGYARGNFKSNFLIAGLSENYIQYYRSDYTVGHRYAWK